MGLSEKVGDLHVEDRGKECVIREVEALKAMGALITKEADSMSAVKFQTNKADKAMWMDTHFYKNKGIAEGKNHKGTERWCNRKSSENWSWNKEMVDALRGWESRNLDLMSSRRWAQRGMSLEWFRANQIREARQRIY